MSLDESPVPAVPEPPRPSIPDPPDGPARAARADRPSRPRDSERATRKELSLWDRTKLLTLFVGGWLVLLWSNLAQFHPKITVPEAIDQTVRRDWWLLALAGLELVRQIHYLISERSPRYHRFWTKGVFGQWERRRSRMSDYTRHRIGRALRWLFWLIILDLVLAKAYQYPAATALFRAPAHVVAALPLVFQVVFFGLLFILQFGALFWFLSKGGVDVFYPDDIETRFTDVWGQDHVLDKVKENMVFLEDPESIETKGGYVPRGILLWGPPGTGKTLMAKAVAGETARPFVFIEPSAFLNMFVGVGVLKVKGLFRKLRRLALRYGGVIAFFDEADSLGNRGRLAGQGGFPGSMGPSGPWSATPACNGLSYLSPASAWTVLTSGSSLTVPDPPTGRTNRIIAGMGGMGMGDGTLQSLLSEMDGLTKPRGFVNRVVRRALGMRPKPPPKYRILIMMASNMPESLDPAMLRPGRLDRLYKVGYPSKAGRIKTYEGYLAKTKHELTPKDVDKLATITPYATGASIQDLVNMALINAIREGGDTVTWKDVVKAKQLKDLGPPEDVEYIERERHAVAIHEACHAVIAYRVQRHLEIDIATIEKGGTYLGLVHSIPPEDQFTSWRSHYEADIMSGLASLAGERLFFDGDSSSGVSNDLENATAVATLMEGYWGMGATVASHAVTRKVGIGPGRPGPRGEEGEKDLLETGLGERIEGKLKELLAKTEQLLRDNRVEVLAVAHALETYKSVTGQDVEAIIEGRQGPLIDGRPYRRSEFARMAEAYHSEALGAHKRHAAVKALLPVLAAAYDVAADRALAGEPGPNGERDERRSEAGTSSNGDVDGSAKDGAGTHDGDDMGAPDAAGPEELPEGP
jgi:cell division protease FtsH